MFMLAAPGSDLSQLTALVVVKVPKGGCRMVGHGGELGHAPMNEGEGSVVGERRNFGQTIRKRLLMEGDDEVMNCDC